MTDAGLDTLNAALRNLHDALPAAIRFENGDNRHEAVAITFDLAMEHVRGRRVQVNISHPKVFAMSEIVFPQNVVSHAEVAPLADYGRAPLRTALDQLMRPGHGIFPEDGYLDESDWVLDIEAVIGMHAVAVTLSGGISVTEVEA